MKEKLLNLKDKMIPFIKANKKALIVVSIAVIIILCIAIVISSNKIKLGNSSGNLNNSGFSAKSDGMVYCLGFNDNQADGIYKVQVNGTNKQKISDNYGLYLNIAENHIYYLEASAQNNSSYNIVKMKKDGSNKETIVEDVDTSKISVVNDWIYYFKNYQLYRIKTNGQNKEKVLDKSIVNYEVLNDYIYYSYINDGKYVIANKKVNGEEINKIDTDAGKVFFISDNIIYYLHENEHGYELFNIKTDGSSKEKIVDVTGNIYLNNINFDDDNVYYSKTNEEGKLSIYSMNIKKKEETKIVDLKGQATMINVNDNYIYYTDINDSGNSNIFVVKTNGEDKVEL